MKDVQELPLEQVMFVCKAGALAHPMPYLESVEQTMNVEDYQVM